MWWTVAGAWAAPGAEAGKGGSATVSATGDAATTFSIGAFGRYAVVASSRQGTAVRALDPMVGVLDEAGVPGEADGRIDLFLDQGPLKVVARSHPEGTGTATIALKPFVAQGEPLALVRTRPVEATLRDLQVRSFWVDVPEGGPVAVEAVGRWLGDLRLWRDGVWLVDEAPNCVVVEPVAGAPWRDCALSAAVEPGTYLVSAYGGPSEPWTTDDADEDRLLLTWDPPTLPSAGVRRVTLPASGLLRYRVPAGVDTVSARLPDVAPFRLEGGSGGEPAISTESRRPAAWTRFSGGGTLTLRGAPGQEVDLTWFAAGATATVDRAGRYWVGSLTSAHPLDVLDPTAVVVDPRADAAPAVSAVTLSSATAFSEAFTLGAAARVLVEVTEDGPYHFTLAGADPSVTGSVKVAPFLRSWPEGFAPPRPAGGSLSVELSRGLYVVEVSGRTGVATLTMGWDSLAARGARALGQGPAPQVRRPFVQLAGVDLDPSRRVELLASGAAGLFVRELPLDPTDALPVALLPGESLEVPITSPDGGVLTVATAAGDPLPLALDGGGLTTEVEVGPGEHVARVVNPWTEPAVAALLLTPKGASRALSPLDPARAAQLDAFPKVRPDRSVGVELGGGVPTTVRLVVDAPGLWTVESTGLLATTGTLRTRTLPALAQDSQSGDGRNFRVSRFLRPGDYQLTAVADGDSAGHAGLRLTRGVVIDGGEIRDATPARVTLRPQEAVRQRIVVPEAGEWRIVHRGRTRLFDCRLEDEAGWTVTGAPDQVCDVTAHLAAGTYVLLGLPDAVESRRATVVERADAPRAERTGHGPFPLALSAPASALWTEPKDAPERPVDVWEGAMPVEAPAAIALSPEMVGTLTAGGRPVATVSAGSWTGTLPKGPFRLEVRAARRGTGVPYTVSVDPAPLVTGVSRPVEPGTSVPVRVGDPGVYTFESDGFTDVRARLLDADGRVVAANDDRPDDWNFRLSVRLDPGSYTLRVDPVGAAAPAVAPRRGGRITTRVDDEGFDDGGFDGEGSDGEGSDGEGSDGSGAPRVLEGGGVTVSMRAPDEVVGPALREKVPATFRPGRSAWLLDVERGQRAEVVVATATARENVGVAIEVRTEAGWRGVAVGTGARAVAVARIAGTPVRLRVWSEDGRGGEVTAEVVSLDPRRGGPAVALGKGWGAVAFGGGAGQYAVRDASAGTWVCGVPGGCGPGGEGLIDAPEQGLVVVREGGTVSAERVRAEAGEPLVVRVGPRPERLDVASGDGPVWVEVRAAAGLVGARVPGVDAPLVVSGGAALLLAPKGVEQVELWGSGPDETDARVRVHPLAAAVPGPAGDGEHALRVPARGVVDLAFSGERHLRVDLAAGLALATGDGRGAWAAEGATAVQLRAASGGLRLFNPTDAELPVRLDVLPAAGGAALLPGAPHEGVHAAAETWVMPVPAGPGAIQVRGAGATWVRADGVLGTQGPFDLGPGGFLTLRVRPGPVLAWVEAPGVPGPARAVAAGPETVVEGAGAVWLSGASVALRLRPPAPAAVSLRAPCPLVATVDGAGPRRVVVADTGDRVDVWVADPAAGAKVELRALAGTALYGELATARSAPVVLGEGLGPEVLLAAGGTAWFAVDVTRDGLVGFGARAEAERVDAVVYDAAGVELARGLATSRSLAPGRYLLALSQGPGTAPVRVRPVVVGLAAPPTTPPDEVIRTYLP